MKEEAAERDAATVAAGGYVKKDHIREGKGDLQHAASGTAIASRPRARSYAHAPFHCRRPPRPDPLYTRHARSGRLARRHAARDRGALRRRDERAAGSLRLRPPRSACVHEARLTARARARDVGMVTCVGMRTHTTERVLRDQHSTAIRGRKIARWEVGPWYVEPPNTVLVWVRRFDGVGSGWAAQLFLLFGDDGAINSRNS